MRLRAEHLAANLEKSGLAPIYLISGDEPLQVMECADAIRNHAQQQGFEERIVFDVTGNFDWNSLLNEVATISLFSSKRLLELRLGSTKPGKEGGSIMVKYAENLPVDNVLIITAGRLDKQAQNTKWFRTLDNAGITVQIWPVTTGQLPGWIKQRVARQGKQINMDAATLIADRVEGNLLAAKQEIDKLCLLINKSEITPDDVLKAVSDSTRFNVFELIESALTANTTRTVRMLNGLRSEGVEPGNIYGILMWELRRLCSMAYRIKTGAPLEKLFTEYRVWDNERQRAMKNCLHRHRIDDMHRLLRFAVQIDRKIKSSDRIFVWDILQAFLLSMAGYPVISHEYEFSC
jgi:DNA polymerase-3 subunit delta